MYPNKFNGIYLFFGMKIAIFRSCLDCVGYVVLVTIIPLQGTKVCVDVSEWGNSLFQSWSREGKEKK